MSQMDYPLVAISWVEWSPAAFARAAAEQKPVLLALTASWCHACQQMDRVCYADPEIAALVNARVVPVKVDTDRRPDINERYNLGGWPTTAFLTPAGEILRGATFLDPGQFKSMLLHVSDVFLTRRLEIEARGRVAVLAPPADDSPRTNGIDLRHILVEAEMWFLNVMEREFDPVHGGFGDEPKFPQASALLVALERYRTSPDTRLETLLRRTLEAMAGGGLHDGVEGGFFRYSATRAWMLPHTEKLLDENAQLLKVYVEAWKVLHDPLYRGVAVGLVRYINDTLSDPANGGFYSSQSADQHYYARPTIEARAAGAPPPVDPTLYVDGNGLMASAYLRAGELLGEPSLGEFAVASLERVLPAVYRPGSGVAHFVGEGPEVRGLLVDHVRAGAALVDAYAATERLPYLMLAEELMRFSLRSMWDARGFNDRAAATEADEDVGLLRQLVKPFGLNCEAAEVLTRLAAATDKDELRAKASETLGALSTVYEQQGLSAADYIRALHTYNASS